MFIFMKSRRTFACLLVILMALLGAQVAPEARAAESAVTRISIGTMPGLRYDTAAFSVRPGSEVELTFTNQDEMIHNLVITAPGARQEILTAALALGANATELGFVPASPKVLWATKLVSANTSATLRFKAPDTLGDYPYVCTFPGHGFVMFGTMIVTTDPKPPVKNSATDAVVAQMESMVHGSKTQVIRQFMPNAGPASIAVGLPGDYSYCWDAGACRFRYAWKGGFVVEVYRRPERLVGDIFYREEAGFPLRIGSDPEAVPDRIQFRGYSFDAIGSPEFDYEVNGVLVHEFIEMVAGKLVRRFRTNAEGKTIWFAIPSDGGTLLTATGTKVNSSGKNPGQFFKFDGTAAKEFYVTVTPPDK